MVFAAPPVATAEADIALLSPVLRCALWSLGAAVGVGLDIVLLRLVQTY